MERNWYVICTTKNKEKKVASALAKKGYENFCPFTIKETKNVSRSRKEYGPLFNSFVFVNVSTAELGKIQKMSCVVNPLYWGAAPAVINNDEINAIKMMTGNYSTVVLEKVAVNAKDKVSIVEKSITGISNNIVTVKHEGISVKLPALGYSLTAERSKEKTTQQLVKQPTTVQSIAQRLNALFF